MASEWGVSNKDQMLGELRTMLRDVFSARAQGTSHPRMARAHGYVDGFMRALLDTGAVNKHELLRLVAEERAAAHGPATADVCITAA
jgi:hypothetical protein